MHELSFAVEQIAVSEMLPRTPELIFVNLTTVEGVCTCIHPARIIVFQVSRTV